MKPKKSDLYLQRQILEKKIVAWREASRDRRPPSGWIKAIRGALGMTTKQLAQRIGVNQPNVVAFEGREAKGSVTIATLEKAARAMNCKLVYAIVPEDGFQTLDEILSNRAGELAKRLTRKISHSMSLEAQEVEVQDRQEQQKRLAQELKENLDSRLWDKK